jgi:aryl-alcohol dehydrogenase-like predicted oxidoreductase
VPSEADAISFLEHAFQLGFRYFDTAPSYGTSEERLGKFLNSLGASERREVTIATKFGEHWDGTVQQTFVDHSYDALRRSLDRSVELLGRVNILQLHKTTPAVLASGDLGRAWEYAASLGITDVGASVADVESARIAVDGAYKVIQLPYNLVRREMGDIIDEAARRGMWVAVNRPFAMGSMIYDQPEVSKAEAFAFVLQRGFRGVILTGTKSKAHLAENLAAFVKLQ